jgi:hypothetical protein
LYTWDGNDDHVLQRVKRGLDAPQLTEEVRDGYTITWNIYATYETTLNEIHSLKAMVGTERQQGKRDYLSAFRKNYISAAIDQMFAGAIDAYLTNGGYAEQNARLNYFGRLNYDLMQKYMAEFVWRYDGSNKFARGKQFGFSLLFHWVGEYRKRTSGRIISALLITSSCVVPGARQVMIVLPNTSIFHHMVLTANTMTLILMNKTSYCMNCVFQM